MFSHRMRLDLNSLLSAVLAVWHLPKSALADCECGYSVSSPYDTTYTFTELLETNFLLAEPGSRSLDADWTIQTYNRGKSSDRLGLTAETNNVIPYPLFEREEGGTIQTIDTAAGEEPGLQLWVRGARKDDGSKVAAGEVATKRNDIQYGSFRAAMKVTAVNGTCSGFFWYYNDTREIDIEVLSQKQTSDAAPVDLSIHYSRRTSNNLLTEDFHSVQDLSFSPHKGYHEYRFDWAPERVSFFADGHWLKDMTQGLPDRDGRIFINHWSDGRSVWSGGPPNEDAVLAISYVKAYFNTSIEKRQAEFEEECAQAREKGASNTLCVIPDQTGGPDPWQKHGTYFVDPAQRSGAASVARRFVDGRTWNLGLWCWLGAWLVYIEAL